MKPRLIGILALICLLGSILWLVLMISSMANAGPLENYEQVLAYVSRLDTLFYLSYLNAAFLVTIPAIVLMKGIANYCNPVMPAWVTPGAVFIPIYGTLNLLVYLSQISIVPTLVELGQVAQYKVVCEGLLRLTIHQWPQSGVAFFNALAYALLGIPSFIFGIALYRHPRPQKVGGVLLALNGVACILGLFGVLTGNMLLRSGLIAGGVLFILALFPLSWSFLRTDKTDQDTR